MGIRPVVLLSVVSFAFAAPVPAAITFYDNQALFNAVVTVSLIDDYETGSVRNAPLASLTRNGVSYTPTDGTPFPNVFIADPGYSNFGAGVGITTTSILTANGDENFRADFATAVRAVAFDAYWNGLGAAVITAYNNNTVLGAYSPAGNPDNKGFLGSITDGAAITGFRWDTTSGGQLNTGIDNLRTAPIPEPGTYAMLLAGLGLLGFVGRRRKRQAA